MHIEFELVSLARYIWSWSWRICDWPPCWQQWTVKAFHQYCRYKDVKSSHNFRNWICLEPTIMACLNFNNSYPLSQSSLGDIHPDTAKNTTDISLDSSMLSIYSDTTYLYILISHDFWHVLLSAEFKIFEYLFISYAKKKSNKEVATFHSV